MNKEAFQQLKRVLTDVPARQFDITNWHDCACGHATQDQWFVARGFSSCNDFGRAASFFQISRREASDLFSEHALEAVTPAQMIKELRTSSPNRHAWKTQPYTSAVRPSSTACW